MNIKDIKSEARQKLPINMHQAIVVYTIEYAIFITIIALISVASMLFSAVSTPAAIVIICYGVVLGILAMVMCGIVNYALVDFYMASYKCTPYNVRRLADTVARNGISKILLLNLIRTLLGVLLTALLIVPGVFYLSRTAMANYLLNANPKLKPNTVLSASGKVMSGKLGSYLALQFSMFGWYALGVVTLGIGFIWISPYLNLTKAVYYKRCLQGDKQVYNIPVQPMQAVPYQQPMPQYQQAQAQHQNGYANAQPSRPIAQEPAQEPTRPIHIDPPVPPIATLGDNDVMDMNAAINDFGGEAVDVERDTHEQSVVSDVPEVPLTSPTAKRKTKSITVTGASASAPAPDDSDIEIHERILSTQEVDESHVYEKRVDALYSRSNPRSDEKPHNYMADSGEQHADDFVTMEYQGGDAPTASTEPDAAAPDGASSDSVMSDEDFAEFIRNFDVPVPDGSEFTPLKQNKTHEPEKAATAAPTEPVSTARVVPERPTATAQAHTAPTERTSAVPHVRPARTAEQVRAEREERLRNLRRK